MKKSREKGGSGKYKDRSIHDSLCNTPSWFAIAMTDRLGLV
jgi:hypothetical protein